MERVFTFADPPAKAGHWVVVALGEPTPDQRHIGILHRDKSENYDFLHLAWHCVLKNDAVRPDYLRAWIAPEVPNARQRIIAAFCRRVWKTNGVQGIPYAFSDPQGALHQATGAFLIGNSRHGLTCSSFVLAVFHAVGLQLADYGSWPSERTGDREWQQSILNKLQERAEQEHIDKICKEIGSVRYRPEEVAASTVLAPPPAEFHQVESLSRQIVDRIRNQSNSASP